MKGLGSGANGEFTFLDVLSVISFLIGVENLEMNVTQEDAQNLQKELADKAELLLREIHGHLEEQDAKIDTILSMLGGKRNDNEPEIYREHDLH